MSASMINKNDEISAKLNDYFVKYFNFCFDGSNFRGYLTEQEGHNAHHF